MVDEPIDCRPAVVHSDVETIIDGIMKIDGGHQCLATPCDRAGNAVVETGIAHHPGTTMEMDIETMANPLWNDQPQADLPAVGNDDATDGFAAAYRSVGHERLRRLSHCLNASGIPAPVDMIAGKKAEEGIELSGAA